MKQIQPNQITPTDKIVRNIKINTIKKDPIITVKKFYKALDTESNIFEKTLLPTKPTKTPNNLKDKIYKTTTEIGKRTLNKIITIEQIPTAFLIKTEQE